MSVNKTPSYCALPVRRALTNFYTGRLTLIYNRLSDSVRTKHESADPVAGLFALGPNSVPY